ncbi:MAG: hypothetical protein DMG73_04715 [Acidobacteria bacterium]|nr:MAG: hypothetical protein DMG73_04715 [Acidobacteriota bacterium]
MTTRDFKLWGKFGARRMKGINFHPKRCGEIAELAFSFKACGMGFVVSKPYGDSAAYDFVVGAKKHLRRVQVKSTSSPGFGRYNVGAQHFHGRGAHAYTREEIDFVVAYIVPRNIWYVVPIKALLKKKHMQLYPDGSRWGGKYEKYCEAWHLLA